MTKASMKLAIGSRFHRSDVKISARLGGGDGEACAERCERNQLVIVDMRREMPGDLLIGSLDGLEVNGRPDMARKKFLKIFLTNFH